MNVNTNLLDPRLTPFTVSVRHIHTFDANAGGIGQTFEAITNPLHFVLISHFQWDVTSLGLFLARDGTLSFTIPRLNPPQTLWSKSVLGRATVGTEPVAVLSPDQTTFDPPLLIHPLENVNITMSFTYSAAVAPIGPVAITGRIGGWHSKSDLSAIGSRPTGLFTKLDLTSAP